jgi:hypothetical protein
MKTDIDRMKKDIAKKAEITETNNIWANFFNYAKLGDLKILHDLTMPAVKKFEDELITYKRDNLRNK